MKGVNISAKGRAGAAAALVGFLVFLMAPTVLAALSLPQVFSDKMVIQREKPVPVWGQGSPGATVTVTYKGKAASTVVADDGAWRATLPTFDADFKGASLKVASSGGEALEFLDVLVGEVWLCSGQSNMEMALKGAENSYQAVLEATRPGLRLFSIKGITWTGKPYTSDETAALLKGDFFKASWTDCVPETAKDFSAVAYYYGCELSKKLKVPVGLICNAVGGSPAEAWTSREAMAADPDLAPLLADNWYEKLTYSWCRSSAKKSLGPWLESVKQAKAAGTVLPPCPGHVFQPTFLFNQVLNPLAPFAIRGVIWYQGESNDRDGYAYAKKFATMIRSWRALWQEELPFHFVQLPNFGGLSSDGWRRLNYNPKMGWQLVRESQRATLALPATAMAVTIELGMRKNIHPKKKKEVGHRLALLARKKIYGEDILAEGPRYRDMTVKGDKVILTFSNVGGSLAGNYGYLDAFSIAGEDRVFHPASARLIAPKGAAVKDRVELGSERVKQPVAVRYGWTTNPECTLYNCLPGKQWPPHLPASPFRTDDWPLETHFVNGR